MAAGYARANGKVGVFIVTSGPAATNSVTPIRDSMADINQARRRLGYEVQARYTFSRFSIGAGYQRSRVFKFTSAPLSVDLSLGFIEPRYVMAAGSGVALYLAGRVGVGKLLCSDASSCQTNQTNLGYGGGGGLLFKLSQRLSADLGGQFFQVNGDLSSGYVMIRAGLGIGL